LTRVSDEGELRPRLRGDGVDVGGGHDVHHRLRVYVQAVLMLFGDGVSCAGGAREGSRGRGVGAQVTSKLNVKLEISSSHRSFTGAREKAWCLRIHAEASVSLTHRSFNRRNQARSTRGHNLHRPTVVPSLDAIAATPVLNASCPESPKVAPLPVPCRPAAATSPATRARQIMPPPHHPTHFEPSFHDFSGIL